MMTGTCKDREIEQRKWNRTSLYQIVFVDERGKNTIGLEDYLIGILPSTIDMKYDMEVLKAQVIVLRSMLISIFEKQDIRVMDGEKLGYTYISKEDYIKKGGEEFCLNYEKGMKAVSETEGIILNYKGKTVTGCYCALSAGKTRQSKDKEYDYLKSVECPENVTCENYLSLYQFPISQWDEIKIVEMDENGYAIQLSVDGNLVSGEEFRMKYHLNSACMKIIRDKEYTIETRGIGHGFGLDQYYANFLAKKQYNFRKILQYFYKNVSFEKTSSYKNETVVNTMNSY